MQLNLSLNNIDANMIYSEGVSHLNVGTGIEHTIKDIALYISRALGFGGDIKFDSSKPDGIMKKSVDTTRINGLGWKAKTSLQEGIKKTCDYYLSLKNRK